MKRAIIETQGPGVTTLIAAVPGMRIIVNNMFLTFSHAEDRSQLVRLMTGSTVFMPAYVDNSHEIEYRRRASDSLRIKHGDPFNIDMPDGTACAGVIEYDLGAQ